MISPRIALLAAALAARYPPDDVHMYVIDTGVRISHSTFGGRAKNGYDFVDIVPALRHNPHAVQEAIRSDGEVSLARRTQARPNVAPRSARVLQARSSAISTTSSSPMP